MGITEPPQFIVDELAPVVRMQNQDRERQVREDRGEGFEDKHLYTIGDGDDLGPSRTAVGDREGVTMISCCLPSIVTHEVHLHLSRSSRSMVTDPFWRRAEERGSGTTVPCLAMARRSSGMAAWSLFPQSSPARWYIQMSPSTTARPYRCFRSLGHGEGLVGTRVTSPRMTLLAYVRSR